MTTWTLAKPIADRTTRAKAEWVARSLTAAEAIAARIKVTPAALVAQGAVESNWGQSRQGLHGLFGQKAGPDWKGLRVLCRTREVIDGQDVFIDDWFRDYASDEECWTDHLAFLDQNSRYRDAGVFDGKGDAAFFQALHRAGYATDPNYAPVCEAVLGTVLHYFEPMLTSSVAPPTAAAPGRYGRVLMVGTAAPDSDVKLVQDALKTQGLYAGDIDGDFGPKTYAAARVFQVSKGLQVDGVVGDETWRALGLAV